MQRKIKYASMATLLAIATANAGCGMFSTKSKGEKGRENDSDLAGEWQGGCSKFDWFGFSYHKDAMKFSAVGDFDKVTTLFGDAGCAAPMGTLSEYGTYAALGSSSSVTDAQDINFTIVQAKVSADSDDAVKLLNAVSYCGISAWQKGQATDVLGKSCGGVNHPKGQVTFDVYRVDNGGKRLQIGKDSLFVDKSDVNSRPSKLDESRAFTKH